MPLRILPNGAFAGDTLLEALLVRDAERLRRYREYLAFYEGRHWTSRPRNSRSSLVLNYARAVVDKGVSYLLGRGLNFAVPAAESGLEPEAARRAERLLYETYQDGELEAADLAAGLNAGLLGDAVFKVVYDPAERRVRVLNVDPLSFFPRWSGDDLGRCWRVDLAYRLEAEEAQRLYGVRARGTVEVVERWERDTFELHVDGTAVRRQPNPYPFIPFVHVANLQPPNECWGVSDIRDVLGLNRALNERISDQADLIRYHADPPVVFKGIADHTDLAMRSTPVPRPGGLLDHARDGGLPRRSHSPGVGIGYATCFRPVRRRTASPVRPRPDAALHAREAPP